jgi:hypothetical protein
VAKAAQSSDGDCQRGRVSSRHASGDGRDLERRCIAEDVVKTIVDAEHGSITVKSSEGIGTTFEVRLAQPAANASA